MIMLTPAEELGLSGHHIDSRVRRAAARLAPAQLRELARRVEAGARERRLIYLRDGQAEAVRILLCPLVLLPDQQAYLHHVSLALLAALKRLPEIYLADPTVRALLPLTDEEQAWIRESWTPGHRDHNPVFGRLDAVVQLTTAHWKESLHFLEPNLNGVGGIHYTPAVNEIISEIVMPALRAVDPQLVLVPGADERGLFIEIVLDHLAAIGRSGRRLCFIEPVDADSGPDEQLAMAEYYKRVYDLEIMHADPRELSLVGDEVYYRGAVIDVGYRDYSIRDLIDLERELGRPLLAMRALFRQNRMISSIAGEFDHKSCWELLTDDRAGPAPLQPRGAAALSPARAVDAPYPRLPNQPSRWRAGLSHRLRAQPTGIAGPQAELRLRGARSDAWAGVHRGGVGERAGKGAGRTGSLGGAAAVQPAGPRVSRDRGRRRGWLRAVLRRHGSGGDRGRAGGACRASQKQVINITQRGGLAALLLASEVPAPGVPLPTRGSPTAHHVRRRAVAPASRAPGRAA